MFHQLDLVFYFLPGFIEFIVLPAFELCGEMMDILLETRISQAAVELGLEGSGGKERAWVAALAENRRKWKEQCQPLQKGKGYFRLRSFSNE